MCAINLPGSSDKTLQSIIQHWMFTTFKDFWFNYFVPIMFTDWSSSALLWCPTTTVKPDVLLMGTLQTSASTLVFHWQFESSKLQPAQATCSVHLVPHGKNSTRATKMFQVLLQYFEDRFASFRSEDTTKANVGNATTDSRKCSLDKLATIATAISEQRWRELKRSLSGR